MIIIPAQDTEELGKPQQKTPENISAASLFTHLNLADVQTQRNSLTGHLTLEVPAGVVHFIGTL